MTLPVRADTVIGVLAATLAAGNSLEEACFFGQCGGRRGGRQTGDIHGFADRAGKMQYVDVQIPALA
ncbi:bifunctional protein HldE [includes: D-beta-D-heptose 7-phosphate kinase; D-beta-D-heptose 1-phosphate adenosyltransferase] [Escherichia coli]|uniref:Bifunctional protein HldE [includes: D-beta-D-heptose 7-phosphate kinase D-beta-D-heptose 1-phosphate adenosyltransferase] n=1 Tax=Escherichia coli TaxID=562 RepID=A0A376VXD6_ECOLX|nr:bifunctional protein HldE [includes: D-beta-D-heptose 7-phosphate kinase; D-beta-D-heptose 1-phosphate adenosyltransferase] [Escherichia coli]